MSLLKEEGSGIKVPEMMRVSIHEERIVILDYSKGDDRNVVLAFFSASGIRPEVQTESWCG